MKKSRFTDRTKWKIIIVLMVGMVVVALFLQAGILMYVNSKNLDKTSQMLLDQSISIIEKNQKNEIDLIRSMKEDYVIRARAVSYILESRLEAENDTEELQKIASLMSIDEIYLFDATGKFTAEQNRSTMDTALTPASRWSTLSRCWRIRVLRCARISRRTPRREGA